ncbi:hypothetical protein NEIRO03_0334 [Nematocida sp. AWRm78]|nr:hypothetical protein NEIRO02_0422 [Nematocida sp. AWRm79]KAI5182683.1 hypothetical protein NEIRO03_0334 [Nematocida sp. AWRm78]
MYVNLRRVMSNRLNIILIEHADTEGCSFSIAPGFLKNIVDHYITIMAEKLDLPIFKFFSRTNRIKEILSNAYKPINRETDITSTELFMCGPIADVSYKCYLIQAFLISTNGTCLDIDNEMVRITANVLNSIPLDDPKIRHELIRILEINKNSRKYYPMFKYNLQDLPRVNPSSMEICDVAGLIYMLDPPVHTAVASLKALFEMYKNTEGASILLSKEYTGTSIIMELYEEGTIDTLADIQTIIGEKDSKYYFYCKEILAQ